MTKDTVSNESLGIKVVSRVRINPKNSRRHCAFPATIRLSDDRILVAYCDSVDHQSTPGGRLMLCESKDQGQTWNEPRKVLGGLPWHYSTTHPMWQKKDGTLVLGVWAWRKTKSREGPTWTDQPDRIIETFEMGSKDGGLTWKRLGSLPSARVPFFQDISWCYGEVRRLTDSSLIRPCYGPDAATSGKAWSVVCLRSEDDGDSWSAYRIVDGRKHGTKCNETDLLELPDGRILAVVRPERGRTPIRLYSNDGGETWGDQAKLGFYVDCPCLHLLSDKRILLLCRSEDDLGRGFFAVVSEDLGKTWTSPQRLLPGGWDSGYPSVFDQPSGRLLAVGYVQTGKNSCEVVALTLEVTK